MKDRDWAVVDTAIAEMQGFVNEIAQKSESEAAFFRAHFMGCVQLVRLGKEYDSLPRGPGRDALQQEMRELAKSLDESLQVLRLNTNVPV